MEGVLETSQAGPPTLDVREVEESTVESQLQTMKRCQRCFQLKPMDQYRMRHKDLGIRYNQCNECHNASERDRLANRKLKETGKQINRFQSRLKATKFEGVSVLCEQMLDRFGGPDGFIDAWSTQLAIAAEKEPGSKRILDFFFGFIRILQTLPEANIDDMSGEELKKHVWETIVLPHVRNEPEIVMEAAEELGWTVSRPGDQGSQKVEAATGS